MRAILPAGALARLRGARGVLALAAASLLAAACGTVPSGADAVGGPVIAGLVFENRTPDALTDVRLRVVASGEYVACGYIPAHATCATTFPSRRYRAAQLELSWTRAGRALGSRPFVVPLPDPLPADAPLEVVIVIGGPGGFDASMRPS